MSDIEDTANLLTNSSTPPPKQCLKTIVTNKELNRPISRVTKFAPAVTVTFLAGATFGYDLGIWNFTLPQFSTIDCRRQHIAIFIWLVGTLVSSFFGGWLLDLIDQYGRKRIMISSVVTIMVGSLIPLTNQSYGILLFGRFVSGMGAAMSVVVHSVYACETSDDNLRGFRVTLQQVGIACGMLVSAGLATVDIPWQYVTWAIIIPALLSVIVMVTCLSESPHYELVQMSRMTQAKRPTSCEAIGTVAETILMGIVLVILHRITARMDIFFMAKALIRKLGICNSSATSLSIILFLTTKMCGTALCAASVDRIGRRILLMLGGACMMICVLALGTFSTLESITGHPIEMYNISCSEIGLEDVPQRDNNIMFAVGPGVSPAVLPTGVPPPYPFLPTPVSLISTKEDDCERLESPDFPQLYFMGLLVAVSYELSYSFSVGPIIWLLLVEMFPAAVRGRATSLCVFFYFAVDYIIPAVASHMSFYITTGGVLLLYSFLRFMYIILIYLFLLETKSKSLHQIAQEIKNISPKTRMYQNLQWLPCLRKNEWLHRQSRCYREASHPIAESTVI